MTTQQDPKAHFWVTCSIIIECATVELRVADELDAYTQAETLFQKDPSAFLRHMVVRTSFTADYAPVDEGEG